MANSMSSPPDKQPPSDWWLENSCRIAAFRLRHHQYISANTVPAREQIRDSVEFVRWFGGRSNASFTRTTHAELHPKSPATQNNGKLWPEQRAYNVLLGPRTTTIRTSAQSGRSPSSAACSAFRSSSGPLLRTLPTLGSASCISISSESNGRSRSSGSCSVSSRSSQRS